ASVGRGDEGVWTFVHNHRLRAARGLERTFRLASLKTTEEFLELALMRRENCVEAIQTRRIAEQRESVTVEHERPPRRKRLLDQRTAFPAQARADEQRSEVTVVEAVLQPLDDGRGH